MAFLDFFRRASSAASADATPSPSALATTAEKGISGTTNYAGRLLTEENVNLQHQRAYGRAGTQQWGEWERIRNTNPFVSMALDFVCQPIRDANWSVQPGDESKASATHAEFVEWCLGNTVSPGLPSVLHQAAEGALTYGFSLFEEVFDVRQTPWGKSPVLTRLAERLPGSVTENGWVNGANGLEVIRQQGPRSDARAGWVSVDLPAKEVLLLSWRRRGDSYQGVSAFRSVWYLCKIQEMLARLIGVSLQREGAGIPVAYAQDKDAKLNSDDVEILRQFLANLVLHEGASAVMPPGWKLDWVYSPGANKGHVVDTYNALGLVILQTLQAQQMVIGVGATGSRAAGETHAAASLGFVAGVTSFLEEAFNGVNGRPYEGTIRKMVDAKFGPQATYPKLQLTLQKSQLDPLTRAQAAAVAVQAGLLRVTPEDENVMREELGFEPRAVEAPAKLEASAKRGPWVQTRPLRASEANLEPQAIANYLDGARDDFEASVRPVVVAMLKKAGPAIKAAMADGDPSEVAELPLDTKKLEAVLESFLERTRTEGQRQVKAELAKAGRKLKAAKDPDDIAAETTSLVESQKKALLRRMTSRIRTELELEAIDAVRTGGDADDVIENALANQLDTAAFRTDAGTAVTRAWNLGRDEAARLTGADEVEYSAILDSATCSPCAELDGTRAKVGSAEHDALLPPNRDCDGKGNCRCLLVYVSSGESEDGE